MSTNQTQTRSSGIGTLSLLGVLFVGLKLTGYIGWSWWWVTAPFWIGAAFVGLVFVIALVVVATVAIFDRK